MSGTDGGGSPERPNVLVVFTDQQRWDTVGAYGSPLDLTPNLDDAAADGTVFEQATSSQPVCAPTRASLQTGQYATTHGVWRNGLVPETETTLAEAFDAAGYDTGYVGKWHLGGTGTDPVPEDRRLGYEDYWRAADALEDTIVVFVSDHGSHFRTRNREYKRSCHESSVRVPLVVRGPGFEGGNRVDRPVSLVDLPPTLLDAAGIDIPASMEGNSAMGLVAAERGDDNPAWIDDVFIQISEAEVGRALRTSRWKYSVFDPDADGWSTPASDRYVERYLYDLHADPYERTNLAGRAEHREVADRLRERLAGRIEAVEDATPDIWRVNEYP